jgi:hypothetical protein
MRLPSTIIASPSTLTSPPHRVEAGQMRVRIGVSQIVDRNDLDFLRVYALIQSAKYISADASIAVDAYFDSHRLFTPHNSKL